MGGILGPTDPDTTDVPGLLRKEDAPDNAFVNDLTNPLLDPSSSLPDSNADVDKALRDVGDFPEPPDEVQVVGEGDTAEVVGFDAEGNRLGRVFRGARGDAERVARNVNQARQRVKGQEGRTPTEVASEHSSAEAIRNRVSGESPGVFEAILQGARSLGEDIFGPMIRGGQLLSEDLDQIKRNTGERLQALAPASRGGGGGGQQATEQAQGGGGGTEAREEIQLADRANPAGVVDALSRIVSTGRGEGTTFEEPDKRAALEELIAGSEIEPDSGVSEGQLEEAEAAEGGPSFLEQLGSAMEDPRVQRGLAQLAQLFGRPEDAHQQVAKSIEEQAGQQIQAQQLQRRLRGEEVEEPETPAVVTQSEEIEQGRRRLEDADERIAIRRQQLDLARKKALMDVLGGGEEESGGLSPDVDRAAKRVLQQVSGTFLPKALQRGFESGASTGAKLAALQNTEGNLDVPTILGILDEEDRKAFRDEVVTRLTESADIDRETAENFFGSFQQRMPAAQDVAGDGSNLPTLSSPEEIDEFQESASPGDTARLSDGSVVVIDENGLFEDVQ